MRAHSHFATAAAAAALGWPAFAVLAQAQPAAPACDSVEHRQFDFWVGRWDVYRSDTDQLVAHSLIEKLYAGCAIRENWMPLGGTGGGSLNSYRPGERRWRQVWADSANHLNEYEGGMAGDAMVLTGVSTKAGGERIPVRITYRRRSDGTVVQTGEQSKDGGRTWELRYEFVYRPAAAE